MSQSSKSLAKGIILFILNLLIATNIVYSEDDQQKEKTLDKISITATRIERDTLDIPASVDIAGQEEVESTKMFNIKEVLEGMPGVLIQSPNQGYDSRLIIRGAGLKARYGVRDIMVLLDGVPITDPDSFTRLDFIDTQLIKQVEVVKGPNSTLWGANAAGGVINILSQSPLERKGGVVKVGFGDFNTQNYHLSYSDNLKEKLYYTISGSRRESENSWRRWNDFETSQGSVQAALVLDDGSTIENYFGYTDASIQLPGKLDQTMYERYLKDGKAKETEGPWQYSGRYSEIFFFNSRWTKEIGSFELKPMVFINSWNHHHPVTGRINDADTKTYGTDIQVNHSHQLLGRPGTLSFGVTGRFDDQNTDYYEYAFYKTGFGGRITRVLSDDKGKRVETEDRKTNLYGIYAQESFQPMDRLIVDLGIRYDDVKFDITGTRTETFDYNTGAYVPASNPDDISKSFSDFSPRLGISYKLLDGLNIYTQVSRGIQTPTESELSQNPQLDLVKVFNYEVGLKARHPKWSIDTAFYFSPVENEVVQIIGEGGESQYINSGKTKKKGFELSASWKIFPMLELGGAYSYTDYYFDDFSEPVTIGRTVVNLDRSGNKLPFIPQNQYSFYATFKHPLGIRFRVESFCWGSYYMDNANTQSYQGYDFITNAKIAYEKGAYEISLNADNLFDKYYAVEVEKDTRGVVRYTPAAPRSVMIQCAYRF